MELRDFSVVSIRIRNYEYYNFVFRCDSIFYVICFIKIVISLQFCCSNTSFKPTRTFLIKNKIKTGVNNIITHLTATDWWNNTKVFTTATLGLIYSAGLSTAIAGHRKDKWASWYTTKTYSHWLVVMLTSIMQLNIRREVFKWKWGKYK